ncbi:MAG: plasmid mobilization relaxosome protein MobC [Pseudolabrys sp.]
MVRPKLKITRNKQFNVSLTANEHATLHQRAGQAGMRPVDYARARLFSEDFRTLQAAPKAHHLDPLVLVHLSRIGNNLNQIARRLNTVAVPSPPDLEGVLAELRAHLRRADP